MKISTRLLLLFFAVAVLPLALFGYLNMQQNEAALRTEVMSRMSGLADKKMIQVQSYLAERVREVRIRVRGPQVMEGISSILKLYDAGSRHSPAYIQEEARLHQYFDRYVEEARLFYDVFLITSQGEVVYSQKHEADFATNLMDGPYRDSQLAWAFRAARMTLEPVISGYEIYPPSQLPALFIAAPIMVGGKFKGIFAVQLNNDLFYQVATDAVGLGLSGEVVFAQRNGDGALYTTPLKHHTDSEMKFRLGLQQIKMTPMFGALSGESGEGMKPDYRGKPSVSAWRYLPELDWGMVVKIDAEEVFAPIAKQRMLLLKMLLGLLLFASLVAYYFSRKIITPLDGLSRTADEVAEGNLNKRADESATGELGQFARAFNRMTERLQGMYYTLEDRIEERTRELNVSNEQLQQEITGRKQAALALQKKGSQLSEALRIAKLGYWEYEFATDEFIFDDQYYSLHNITAKEAGGYRMSSADFVRRYLHPEYASRFGQNMKQAFEAVDPDFFAMTETQILRGDGGVVWVAVSYRLKRDSQGRTIGLVGINQDITERKQAEEKIHKLNDELEFKVRERTQQLLEAQDDLVRKEKLAVLGQVAGSVGHELRNPLGVMSNAVYFLQTILSDTDDITKEYLDIIKSEIAASERIVGDLLDSVRTKPPHPETVGLEQLIEQSLGKCTIPPFVTVNLDIPAMLPPVRVDSMQIHQVLRNLISNGVEAMPEGGMLEIRVLEKEAEKNVTISVSDTGIGMTPEQQAKLFQPLYSTKARGIGLGLVVVKNLTEANGGSVKVESEPGKGTLFTITLPGADKIGVSI